MQPATKSIYKNQCEENYKTIEIKEGKMEKHAIYR